MVRRNSDSNKSLTADRAGGSRRDRRPDKDDRRVRKRKPNMSRALQEIKHLRRTTDLVIPKLPFSRLVRGVIFELFPRLGIERIQSNALQALQEAVEMYMVQFFEDTGLMAFHGNRVTVMRRDIIMLRRLRGRDDIINR